MDEHGRSSEYSHSSDEIETGNPAKSTSGQETAGSWTVVEEIVDEDRNKGSTVIRVENIDDTAEPTGEMLYRSPNDTMVGGVCAGLANYLGWEPYVVRILWVGATLATGGGGIAAYLALWLLLPVGTVEAGQLRPAAIELNQRSLGRLSYALIGVGGLILLSNLGILPTLWSGFWSIAGVAFWPAVLFGIGFMLLNRNGADNWRGNVQKAGARFRAGLAEKMPSREAVRSNLGRAKSKMPLRRSRNDRIMMGVCGGIGRRVGIDANLIRLGWVLLTFFSGGFPGLVAYFVLGLILPEEHQIGGRTSSRSTEAEIKDVQIL